IHVKYIFAIILFAALSPVSVAQETSEISTPPNGDNQKAEVSQWIGPAKISILYHSPHVHNPPANDRTGHIWGELVHYGFFDEGFGPTKGAPWRAGANESTSITFSNDVKVEGKDLKAGIYALFLDVEQTGPWYWIFSNHLGWGSYQYDPKYDALRVPVTPQDAPFTEFLTYGFDDRKPDSTVAFLQWEKKRIPFKIEVPNVNELYVAKIRQELESWPGFRYEDWQTAAQFCADNKINLEEALTWADKAISGPFRGATVGHEEFSTLQTKAAVLSAMGRNTEAEAVMQKALHLPGTEAYSIYAYGMGLLRDGKKDKAMEVFHTNQRQHAEEKFWTALGLARGYTAIGDKKNAIASWELVLRNVPSNLSNRTAAFEQALKKLKESS
ncbi:MAG TPA: DUF2911 domain-containing protein, partial [Candidatus Angelobacter sp.]|nr:DUF2911 domain-containing protein [Candidatus Angelobacter sp.]